MFYLQVIQEAIDVFQKKNETFKLASKELNVDEPVSEKRALCIYCRFRKFCKSIKHPS